MNRLHLLSRKSFDWDGERFHRDGDYTCPTIPEVEELAYMLQREAPSESGALTTYLRKHFGEGDVTGIRGAKHALEWIEKGAKCCHRRIDASELKLILDRGEMRCIWCGSWLPDRETWFCPDGCYDGFRSRCDPGYIKGLVDERDKGICAECGKRSRKWEMDHIIPVSQGGGLCDLSNYQTLCVVCHNRKTRSQRLNGDVVISRPKKILALSDSPLDQVADLADSIRNISSREDTLPNKLRSGARLLRLAIGSGAFGDAKFKPFREAFADRLARHEQGTRRGENFNEHMVIQTDTPFDGLISAWGEALWWLRGCELTIDVWPAFASDCKFVADLVDAEATKMVSSQTEEGAP